jgi:L-seryl-tRNA(Ser) seleniumtransferase
LRRAVRVDKVTIAALQEVARSYLFAPGPGGQPPLLAQVFGDAEAVRARAEHLTAQLGRPSRAAVVADEAVVGGGSLSAVTIPSWAVCVRCADEREAVGLARALRSGSPSVFSRIKGNEVRVNMTTIRPHEDAALARSLQAVLGDPSSAD